MITLLVRTKSSAKVSKARARKKFDALGVTEGREIPHIRVKVLTVDDDKVSEVMARLSKDPDVEFVEESTEGHLDYVPSDPNYSQQWHLAKINAPSAWDITKGSPDVKVAVLDTGFMLNHPDLAPNFLPGVNTKSETLTTDLTLEERDHGTMVAGLVAAVMDNGEGVVGVAPGCKIVPVKVFGSSLSVEGAIRGVIWAADQDVDVISCSWGYQNYSAALYEAFNYVFSKGITAVVSAGNDGIESVQYPAVFENVITVAATDQEDAKPDFSSYGAHVDLSAPGVDISTTHNSMDSGSGGTSAALYVSTFGGTSASTPIVAGVSALIRSRSKWSPKQVKAILTGQCDTISTPYSMGAGRVNAYKSISAAAPFTLTGYAFPDKNTGRFYYRGPLTVTLPMHGDTPLAVDWSLDNIFAASPGISTQYTVQSLSIQPHLIRAVIAQETVERTVSVEIYPTDTVTSSEVVWEDFSSFPTGVNGLVWTTMGDAFTQENALVLETSSTGRASVTIASQLAGKLQFEVITNEFVESFKVKINGVVVHTTLGQGTFRIQLPYPSGTNTFVFETVASEDVSETSLSEMLWVADSVAAEQWSTPLYFPPGGRYSEAQTVTINLEGTIIFTTDGSNPLHYIPTNDGKAVFDESGVLVLTDEPYAPDI